MQDRNKLFINGFDQTFRDRLTSRLYVKNPDHPLHRPWPMDDVAESARFFLASNSATNEPNHYSYPLYNSQSQFDTFTSIPPAPARKTFDMSLLEQFMVSDIFISKLVDKLGLGNTGGHLPNNTILPTVSHFQPPRPEGCVRCLDRSHYHQSYPIITDYISRGLCKRDDMKRVVLMDGTLVTTRIAPGKCIKECIDNWLKSRTQPTISTNMVKALQTASTSQALDTPINEVYVSEVSTADLEELHMLDSVAVSTLKQADSIRKRISNTAKGKTMPTPATRSTVKAGKASLIPTFSHTSANTQSSPISS